MLLDIKHVKRCGRQGSDWPRIQAAPCGEARAGEGPRAEEKRPGIHCSGSTQNLGTRNFW